MSNLPRPQVCPRTDPLWNDSDPLDWIGIKIAAINCEISNAREMLEDLNVRHRRLKPKWTSVSRWRTWMFDPGPE